MNNEIYRSLRQLKEHPRQSASASKAKIPSLEITGSRQFTAWLIDVSSNEVILRGLSLPHSPRWYRDKLWLLNSGTGDFGYVDQDRGVFKPVAFCSGYLRGLAFNGDFAVVGLSKPRNNKTFSGLSLDERMHAKDVEPPCGLMIIDLRNGDIGHWLRIEGVVEEWYDVTVLPGLRRPMSIGFKTDEIRRVVTIGSQGFLFIY